ncbi:hypothetical protein PHYSODRAFT_286687 [Phytophthora sojae]|uniref:RxLR effector protein n=2 Tax=Phytophthora sojae TaxID=67593 RepID=G4ZVD7_PHYSP|nr:hypothetical protein PHYSODRAFT_286687 [Phytophthora sojae]AEK80489.1 Avh19 [Phytophthora sojae]AEK80490.1 Avh19 [Phytophthora sojae]AEK80491.1 Avh19 [Phytophthora sojae]EGZ13761.1 hypothetical protein PHYSODRAFT_286687 [Phytophthora sojae]|eukprot:XP_009531190.1 hypothetical protein PHYSODRAFT_286687 [Phytophthora sojae]
MHRSYVLLLVVVVLLALCGGVSAGIDQTKSSQSGKAALEDDNASRFLRSHKNKDGAGDEERSFGSALKKLVGLDGLPLEKCH